MNLHKAILTIHTSVVSINGDTQDTIIAWHHTANTVPLNWPLVTH